MTDSLDDGDDEVVRILKDVLEQEDLPPTERETVVDALAWHNNEQTSVPMSLPRWPRLLRIVGDDIALRLDDGIRYYYLIFDETREKTAIIDPVEHDKKMRPIESTSGGISSIFEDAGRDIVLASEIEEKVVESLTVAHNEEYGIRVLYGDFQNGVELIEDDGEVYFTPIARHSLPEPMLPEDIKSYIKSHDELINRIEEIEERLG